MTTVYRSAEFVTLAGVALRQTAPRLCSPGMVTRGEIVGWEGGRGTGERLKSGRFAEPGLATSAGWHAGCSVDAMRMGQERRSILIVEDSADVREAFVFLLEDAGYRALEAGSGREALAKLHADPDVAVIVLDALMPEMDGYEFRAAQLAIPSLAHIPVVMLSGDHAMPGRARSLGIAHWLRKPSDPEALLDLLHSCANGR